MLRLSALMLLGCFLAVPARAGLFVDEELHKKVEQLESQAGKLEARVRVLEDAAKQQTRAMLDLQAQLEALNGELRKLRGQNEELAHGLLDAEKRQKDFYVDLDTRVRHFESVEEAAKNAPPPVVAPPVVPPAEAATADPSDPAAENRAYENAYALFKSGNRANAVKAFQEFIKKYPDSVHVPNASFWLGNAQFALKNYKSALLTYQGLLKDYPNMPKAAEAMLDIAECQRELNHAAEARKILKQLIAKYPDSDAAVKARKRLAAK